jgi:hypothetical protein
MDKFEKESEEVQLEILKVELEQKKLDIDFCKKLSQQEMVRRNIEVCNSVIKTRFDENLSNQASKKISELIDSLTV